MKPPYILLNDENTPTTYLAHWSRERHNPPLQPLCNKATKQTKTISVSVSLIVLVHVDRFHEKMACLTTPSINGIYYFATYNLSSSFSSYSRLHNCIESNSSTTNTKTSGLGLGFFFVLRLLVFSMCSALYAIGSHFVNLKQLRTITITILYKTFKPIFFLIQV